MSVLRVKQGVVFKAFTPALLRILGALESIATQGRTAVPGLPDDVVITSANDGTHMVGSSHGRDEALDIRSKSFPNKATKQQFEWELKARLGPLFTVLFEYEGTEREHWHVQRKQ